MATINPVRIPTPQDGPACRIYQWPAVSAGDTCIPVVGGLFNDKSIQFTKAGAFGGSFTVEGAINPSATARFGTLTDPSGSPLSSITDEGPKQILGGVYQVRPVPGAGVAGVDVWLMLATAR
jgi:hypothetical protein